MPGGCGVFASSSALERDIHYSHGLSQLKYVERNGVETIVQFCSQKVLISSLLYWYNPREGLGTAKLFMGVAWNDITVNSNGGATRNNSKHLCQASSFGIKLIQILP